ncbi:hypothetical protein [Parabacteroides distasonis]|uniref:hypothetical protein n=1 Tax=Parabacteroides distasonis TaxID=823 RepID=UPI001C3C28AD|nr:hypothetical protein [Parabacteroides distasonis]MCR1851913.1 hypothetical protein [Parabacteroides distasonis]
MEDKAEIEKYIHDFILNRPHVFILGAGATIAAIPNGDRNGLKCSVMNNFLEELDLSHILSGVKLKTTSTNLEDIYSELDTMSEYSSVKDKLENKIIQKFSQYVLPDQPTIYDYLILSLRSKDYIFTFNWDDLLIQAYNRVCHFTKDLPQLVFLHGNIGVGICDECGAIQAYRNSHCYKCDNKSLHRPKLLFPVKKKNYNLDPYISNAWNGFLEIIKNASILTVFGYSAPKTDVEAIKAMKTAFSSTFRRYDQIEIIDVKPESELLDTWDDFIQPTNYHVKTYNNLFDSFVGEFPRRSIEGYYKRLYSDWWGQSSLRLKSCNTFDELKDLLSPLIQNEYKKNFNVI